MESLKRLLWTSSGNRPSNVGPRINLNTFCVHASGKLIGLVDRKRIAGDALRTCSGRVLRCSTPRNSAPEGALRTCSGEKRVRQGRLPLLFRKMRISPIYPVQETR